MSVQALPPSRGVRLGPAAAGRCRRRVHLDADPDAPRDRRTEPDDGLRTRITDLTDHRDRLRTVLAGHHEGLVTGWTPESAERPALIWAPTLRSATRSGGPDLLVKVDDGYLPVIVRGHRTLDRGAGAPCSPLDRPLDIRADSAKKMRRHGADALQLAHHHRLLAEFGLASGTARGGVIGRGGPSADPAWDDGAVIVWHSLNVPGSSALADYDLRFADRLAVATAAATGTPALASPSRIGECRRCPWWPVCSEELEAMQDISLIAAGTDVTVLNAAGVHTLHDLADMPTRRAETLQLTGFPATEAKARARARLRSLPLVRRTDDVQVRRADVELDIDMESFADDGAYLWGTFLSGIDVGYPSGYQAFVTWEALPSPDEGRAFAEFWQYLKAVRQTCEDRGLTFAAYCYSRAAEERWLRSASRRFPEQPGMPPAAEVAAFCASPEWVDLHQVIGTQFVVPGSKRLKALAPLTGFSWRDPEPGGENSMSWYRGAIGADTGTPDPELARRVLHYNEDDVLATYALRRWITDSAHTVPTVAELEAD